MEETKQGCLAWSWREGPLFYAAAREAFCRERHFSVNLKEVREEATKDSSWKRAYLAEGRAAKAGVPGMFWKQQGGQRGWSEARQWGGC